MRGPGAQLPIVAQLGAAADQFAALTTVMKGARAMALAEKAGLLAGRMATVHADMAGRMDTILNRLAAVEAHSSNTFSAIEAVVADAEAGAQAAESALVKLTNGPPA